MKALLLLIVALALLSCAPPTAPAPEPVIVYVEVPAPTPPAPPVEDPPAPEPAAPVWQPEPWHIYVLDAADAILYEEEAQPADNYRQRLYVWGLTVELWNRDNPGELQHVVGGGVL